MLSNHATTGEYCAQHATLGALGWAGGAWRKVIHMTFFLNWIATSLATMAAIYLLPGIRANGGQYLGPIMFALALALVNALVKPVMEFFSFPITVLTLGLFLLVINALMLQLASWLSTEVIGAGITIDSFGNAFVGAIIISIVSSVIGAIIGA